MSELDRPETLNHDSLGLIATTGRSPEAFDAALASAEALEIPFPSEEIENVVVCGMGGSAIAADLVATAYVERLTRPLATVRDYYLPGWVGENTLVIAASYSGNTEETLTCTMEAFDRTCPAIGIASGGKLATFYADRGLPVITVPQGLQPRAALLHILVPIVVVLSRLEVLPPLGSELAEARETLRAAVQAYGPDTPEADNPAKQLAAMLHEGVPMIYGAQQTSAIACRWKCQLNENAKAPAFWAALPELDHNEIVGFEKMGRFKDYAHVVMLRDPRHHRQVERRFDLTRELIEPSVRAVTSVVAEGQGSLARMLDLVLLGDYVSLYLGCLRGVDPGPVDIIERLKELLASTGYGRTTGAS